MAARRVFAGEIAQESHSFNPVSRARGSFAVSACEAAVALARGTNSTLGGIVDAAAEAGVEVVVPALFRAQSGGPVAKAFGVRGFPAFALVGDDGRIEAAGNDLGSIPILVAA